MSTVLETFDQRLDHNRACANLRKRALAASLKRGARRVIGQRTAAAAWQLYQNAKRLGVAVPAAAVPTAGDRSPEAYKRFAHYLRCRKADTLVSMGYETSDQLQAAVADIMADAISAAACDICGEVLEDDVEPDASGLECPICHEPSCHSVLVLCELV